jgi:serine phosphatase RsbU (regulator of sigma subunit)
MTLLSQREARLRAELGAAHANLTIAHRDLSASREALLEAHRLLQEDLRRAERYVRAILPAPTHDPFAIDWRFIPSAQLGGDAFGYHWIDDDHLALYVLDVCGHGLKAALLSVSAMNVLRNQTLPSTDFRQPAQVLVGMNNAFQMIQHDMMYLTLWYGVYEKSSRELLFANAGHPPAILLSGAGDSAAPVELANHQMLIGAFPSVAFEQQTYPLPESGRLYIFSDGIYEITRPDGTMLTFKEFVDILSSPSGSASAPIDDTIDRLRAEMGGGDFDDDVSIIEITL